MIEVQFCDQRFPNIYPACQLLPYLLHFGFKCYRFFKSGNTFQCSQFIIPAVTRVPETKFRRTIYKLGIASVQALQAAFKSLIEFQQLGRMIRISRYVFQFLYNFPAYHGNFFHCQIRCFYTVNAKHYRVTLFEIDISKYLLRIKSGYLRFAVDKNLVKVGSCIARKNVEKIAKLQVLSGSQL